MHHVEHPASHSASFPSLLGAAATFFTCGETCEPTVTYCNLPELHGTMACSMCECHISLFSIQVGEQSLQNFQGLTQGCLAWDCCSSFNPSKNVRNMWGKKNGEEQTNESLMTTIPTGTCRWHPGMPTEFLRGLSQTSVCAHFQSWAVASLISLSQDVLFTRNCRSQCD